MPGSYFRNPHLEEKSVISCFSCGGELEQLAINVYKMEFDCKKCNIKISLITKEGIPVAAKALGIVK